MIDPKALEAAARAVANLNHYATDTNKAKAAITAYHKHLAEAGLVIVPREPSEFMLDCALVAQAHVGDNAQAVWDAMLAAHEGN
jgi:Flp pilus assembly protein TadG